MNLSTCNIERIQSIFPQLHRRGGSLTGKLEFAAELCEETKRYTLLDPANPSAPIRGEYDIEIDFNAPNPYRAVFEVGGRIEAFAEELNIPLIDLHTTKRDGDSRSNVCISGYLDERHDIDIETFLCEVVVPFFCDLEFFVAEKQWPRGEYPHGVCGLLEEYLEAISLHNTDPTTKTITCVSELKKQVSGKCLQRLSHLLLYGKKKINGSIKVDGKRVRDILGPKAFEGLWRLKDNIYAHKLSNLLTNIHEL